MENSALKIEIIQKIIETDTIEILMEISEILSSCSENSLLQVNESSTVYEKTNQVYVLNEWQKARIEIALKQFENGDYLTEEEDKIEMEKWFKEEEKLYGQ